MKYSDVLEGLCVRDPRNPHFIDIYGDEDEFDIPEPRKDCNCDSCFYGTDKFAFFILESGINLEQ